MIAKALESRIETSTISRHNIPYAVFRPKRFSTGRWNWDNIVNYSTYCGNHILLYTEWRWTSVRF